MPNTDAMRKINDAHQRLREARKIGKRRDALKYRRDNIEWCRLQERNYHRKKAGIPLDAPLMNQKIHPPI